MAHKHEHMPTSNEDTRTYRPLSVEERDRLAQQEFHSNFNAKTMTSSRKRSILRQHGGHISEVRRIGADTPPAPNEEPEEPLSKEEVEMRKEEAVAEERLAALRMEAGEEEGGAGERGEEMGKLARDQPSAQVPSPGDIPGAEFNPSPAEHDSKPGRGASRVQRRIAEHPGAGARQGADMVHGA